MEPDRYGVAEYLVDEVRTALTLDRVPADPVDAYLLPGPAVPLSVAAGDGKVSFDGERVQLEWNWKAEEAKTSVGTRTLALADIVGVEWWPSLRLQNGFLRFTVRGAPAKVPPKYDPNAVELWGFRKDPLMALVAAAVQARLPHPAAVRAEQAPLVAPAPDDGDHDVLLRRLRELGDLHRSGVLTDEEFTRAKRAVLDRM